MKFLLILILINSAQSSFVDKFGLKNDYQDIGNYLNKLISDYNSKYNEIHDVAVINLITDNSHAIIDEVVRGIPQENPIRIPRVDQLNLNVAIKKCEFVIVVTDSDNVYELAIKIETPRFSSYWSMNSKVILITTNGNYHKLSSLFMHRKISNGIIVAVNNGTIKVISYDLFADRETIHSQNITDSATIFKPSISKDLHGYNIKVMIHMQFPKITINDKAKRFVGKNVDLIRTIANHVNASVSIGSILDVSDSAKTKQITEVGLKTLKADISLNTIVVFTNDYNELLPRLLAYDEDAFCALVPMPKPKGFFEIAFRPFDNITWIFLIVALSSCLAVIIIFRCLKLTNTSPLNFIFMVYGFFLSQSPEIRTISLAIKIIQQCLIFMILILNSIYNSIITSSLIGGRNGEKYSTFDELFNDEKLNFKVSAYIYKYINESDDWNKILNRTVIKDPSLATKLEFLKQLNSSVLIAQCDFIEGLLYQTDYTFLADKYYLLPERIWNKMAFLHLSLINPLRSTFQYFTDRAFDSGLMEYWKTLHSSYLSDKRHQKDTYEMENEDFYLKLNDLTEVFYILIIGWVISAFVFLIEIFWHDCFSVLLIRFRNELKMKKDGNKMMIQRRKVRRIRVRAINDKE